MEVVYNNLHWYFLNFFDEEKFYFCLDTLLPNRQHRFELRNNPDIAVPIVKSIHKGLESLSYLGSKIWDGLPLEIKVTKTLLQLKTKIKKWYSQNCPCRLCKI